MKIQQVGIAGTMESSDILVTVSKSSGHEINIDLDSSVQKEFGHQIYEVIRQTVAELGLQSAEVKAVDKGALDCTIRARVKSAVHRACQDENYHWEKEN
jgi:citrate lyase subunit gamma (acyl carrier protein)